MSLTLYYHPLASYCQKVLVAVYESGADVDKRLVDLASEADRAELAAIWPLIKFPVLRDHERQRDLPESSIIIEYLDQQSAGPRRLIPQDADCALDVRLWDRFFDNHVQGPMQAIVNHKLAGAMDVPEREYAALAAAYGVIDNRLASRAGQWIAGDDFSMADCAAAPALFYAATLEDIPAATAHLADYFERLMARPSVARMLDEARPYFSFYPFADRIPARFLQDM